MENKIIKNSFLIIDGDSFIHRAYHGYKNDRFSTEKNFLIKGFMTMITKEINERKPEYLAVVLDFQGDSFRKEIYPEYKANRPPKTKEFLKQVEEIHIYVKASGLPYFCEKGVEGDDVIGYLAKKAQLKKWKTTILTGDKDIAQIIDENTRLVDTRFKREINIKNLNESFGVNKPEEIIDLLALQGDKADNILGLEGCGEKTALKIINDFGSIDNLIEAPAENIYSSIRKTARSETKTQKIIQQVKETPEVLLLSKTLTTLKTDFEMNLSISDIKPKAIRFKKEKIIEINTLNNLNYEYVLPKVSIDFFFV